MQSHDQAELSPQTLKKVEALMPFASILDFVGGEPLLLDSFREVIQWGKKYACDMETVTNGVLLDDFWRERFVESLSSVRISVDGATPKTYQYVRRHSGLFKVLKNIGELALLKIRRGSATPSIEINFVAMRANIRELPKLVAMAGELGVDVVKVIYMLAHTEELAMQSLYFMQEESDACMRLALEVGKRVGVGVKIPGLFADAQAVQETKRRNMCSGPWHFLGIEADGSTKICCGGAPYFGNLNTQTFQDIWTGAALRQLRHTINTPAEPEYCKNCAHGGDNLRRVGKHILNPDIANAAAAVFGVKSATPGKAGGMQGSEPLKAV